MLPSSRYEPSTVSSVQGSTSKPAGTVSMLGAEPKLTKKRKLVKRLKKLKQTFLGKNRAVGRMQTIPDSTLYYANQDEHPKKWSNAGSTASAVRPSSLWGSASASSSPIQHGAT